MTIIFHAQMSNKDKNYIETTLAFFVDFYIQSMYMLAMLPFILSVILGVASSLIVIFLGYIASRGIESLKKYFGKEIPLPSEWTASYCENGSDKLEVVKLKQWARSIHGTITCGDAQSGYEEYPFEGQFYNRILTATYFSSSPSIVERGVFVLEYSKDGKFEGKYLFLSQDGKEILSSPYRWNPHL